MDAPKGQPGLGKFQPYIWFQPPRETEENKLFPQQFLMKKEMGQKRGIMMVAAAEAAGTDYVISVSVCVAKDQ